MNAGKFDFNKGWFPYVVGLLLTVISFCMGEATYKDYGVSWDEPFQHSTGLVNYKYVFNGDKALDNYLDKRYGAAYELLLTILEKKQGITDDGEIMQFRHRCTHTLFLIACLAGFLLLLRLYGSTLLAGLGYVMIAYSPRIYAHSFFNTKDIPFLSLFLISLWLAHIAFDRRKWYYFAFLGAAVGITTGLRVMGIMLDMFLFLFIAIDLFNAYLKKEKWQAHLVNMLVFVACFALFLVGTFPYLWASPVNNFIDCYETMAHYNWKGSVFIDGEYENAWELPWTYLPRWFTITTPLMWLALCSAGIVWWAIDAVKGIKTLFTGGNMRHHLLHFLCFIVPVWAVIALHSVIYDDWRHLYFVYPSFVLLGIYALHRLFALANKPDKVPAVAPAPEAKPLRQAGAKASAKAPQPAVVNAPAPQPNRAWMRFIPYPILGAVLVQTVLVFQFMAANHPFQQVYFNHVVSHDDEYLRLNFEMDYWGASFKEGLSYIAAHDTSSNIAVWGNVDMPLENNICMLKPADRKRIRRTPNVNEADYVATSYRGHPGNYPPANIYHNIKLC
ncbi:MAG: hypothetical protein EBX41_09200, partial [Chitinophagia bacterium]|nr:hypothetical protein [Chitinophagia bacterium]